VPLLGQKLTRSPETGTADVRYDKIGWTGPNFSSSGCALEKLSITAGKIITGGATFAKGNRDTPIHLSLGGPYLQEIHLARNINVVLYDTKDRRGWLVDGASALLHIVRTQLSSSPYCSSPLFKIEDFQHADPGNGANAAQVALTDARNMEMAIFEDIERWSESTTAGQTTMEETKTKATKWCFQDLVRQTWHILEQIQDHQSKMLAAPGTSLRFTDRDKLEGFGFMDIVIGQNPLRPRVSVLKSSGRGWVDFTRSIGAISLLGRGFGDLIVPAFDANDLCRAWESVPKDQDYLVVCTTTLQEICRKNGDTESDPLELVQDIYWYKADKLFESCACKFNRFGQTCDRVQVLLPPLSVGSKKHPDPFQNINGAAIFGRSRRFKWHWPNVGSPEVGTQSEHDTDDEDNLADSGLGTDISTSALEASRSADSVAPETPPTSEMSPPETQVPRTTLFSRELRTIGFRPSRRATLFAKSQAGTQSVSGDDLISPASVKPTAQSLTSSSSSCGIVAQNPAQSPIHDNATASPEGANRAIPQSDASESTPIAAGHNLRRRRPGFLGTTAKRQKR
jgi:hypothetical protein